jgi:Endonuclease domain
MCRVIVALFTINTQRLGNSGLIQHDSWWRPTELTSHRASARPGSKCRPHWGATIPTGRSSLRSTGRKHLYFVVETKSSLYTDDLRDNEAAKIACGKAHFQALATGPNSARYIQATKVDDIMGQC